MIKKFIMNKFNKDSLKDFPLTLLFSFAVTIINIKYFKNYENKEITSLIFSLYLMIPITAKFESVLKYRDLKFKRYYIALFINFLAFYFYIKNIGDNEKPLSVALIFFCCIAFFLLTPSKDLTQEDSNLKYFVRSLSQTTSSFVFTMILYLGLMFIIYSLKELFGINFSYEIYGKIYIGIMGLFFVPVTLISIENERERLYSKFLEFLLLKVLFPLLVIYLIILYVYIIKIVVVKVYPKNIVPYLTLFYSLCATFFYYITMPLENKFLTIFRKYFFYTLIPLIVVATFSIVPRVKQYSLTENRYFILIAIIWLTFITLVNLVFKKRNTIIVKNSLLIVIFISAVGPLSSIDLSKYFQNRKLHKLLEISKESLDKKELYEVLNYFYNNHSLLDTHLTKEDITPKELMKQMGYEYIDEYDNKLEWYNFEGEFDVYEIKDYDYFIPNLRKAVYFEGINIELTKENEIIIKKGSFIKKVPLSIIAKEFVDRGKNSEKNSSGQIVYKLEYSVVIPELKKEFLIIFKDFNFSIDENNKLNNPYYDMFILVKNKS